MGYRLGLGLGVLPSQSARTWWRLVERCEAGGVDSLWQTDRLATRLPYLESLSAMAAAAGATERLKFGMNAVVLPFRDPLVLARQCATIDFLSGGRLLPVFGVGQESAPEWAATGRSPRGRGRLADEMLEICKRLWEGERVDYAGEHFRYEGAAIAPVPVQQPLPCWIGGMSRAAVRRTARLGTGWLGGLASPEAVGGVVDAIRAESARVGRAVPEDHYGATLPFRLGPGSEEAPEVQAFARAAAARAEPGEAPARLVAAGSAEAVLARLREYAAAGASKFVGIPIARDEADLLDQVERATSELVPALEAAGFAPAEGAAR